MMFVMCAEKVDRFSAMLCPSPTSHRYALCMQSALPSPAGTCRPLCAIIDSRPTVLSITVLPPVLGPVTITPRVPSAISKSSGTQAALSSSGWRAPRRRMRRSSVISGSRASIAWLSLALANTKSSSSMACMLRRNVAASSSTSAVSV